MEYVGNSCWSGSVRKFMETPCTAWFREMSNGYKRVTYHSLTSGMTNSWVDGWEVLHEALARLPEKYQSGCTIHFEGVIPGWKYYEGEKDDVRRFDTLIMSGKSALVLEFKQFNEENYYDGWTKTVKSQLKLLREYKTFAKGLVKHGALVLTKAAANFRKSEFRCEICSRGSLANVIEELVIV